MQRRDVKKTVKRYLSDHKNGGWVVDVLECGHASILGPSAAKKFMKHVCGICKKSEIERAAKAAKKAAAKTQKHEPMSLRKMIAKYGPDKVLAALVAREKVGQAASKAKKLWWAKRKSNGAAEPEAPEGSVVVS